MELWALYGFRANPYRITPLEAIASDDDLYESRGDAEAQFASSVTDAAGGVVVISGDLGTGKTSFANVLQHRILNRTAGFGLRPLPSYFPSQFVEADTATSIARKVVDNTVRSVKRYCELYRNNRVPSETKRYSDWLFGGATQQFAIAGTGRTVSPVSAVTVEACADILSTIAKECQQELDVDGLFVCLDNAETIGAARLTDVLKELRDSLLSLPRIWWIIIGPKDLYSKIQQHNKAVSQRIVGQGIELESLTGQGFHDLIQKRVLVYGAHPNAKAPLSAAVHQRLHDASAGELRFALKTGHDVLVELNAQMYKFVRDKHGAEGRNPENPVILGGVKSLLREKMGGAEHFQESISNAAIARICAKALRPLGLPAELTAALQQIGVRPFSIEDLTQLNVPSEFACVEFLEKLHANDAVRRVSVDGINLWAVKRYAYLMGALGGWLASR